MAITSNLYGPYILGAVNGDIPIATNSTKLKVALVKSTYTPNQDAHRNWAEVSEHEAVGTGYTAGGKNLTGVSVAYNASTNTLKIDAADVLWTNSTLTARYAVIYYADAAKGNPLIGYIDFGQDINSYLGDYSIVFNSAGVITLSLV